MKTLSTLFFVLFCCSLWAQVKVTKTNTNVSVTQAVLLGESIEVRDLVASGSNFKAKKKDFKRDRKIPDNFKGRRGTSKATIKALEHLGPDPLLQLNINAANIDIEPIVNVVGIGDFGSPHDPTGDIGRDYYIQAINVTDVGIFDKAGILQQEFAMADLWAPLGASSAGDPIVLYDEVEERWFITEFTDPANLLIAVSTTSDPFGSYYAYSFSTPSFPDYPKYALWPDALVVTSNEGGTNALHQYFIDKAGLVAGNAAVDMQRVEIPGSTVEGGFFVTTPVDVDGNIAPTDNRPLVVKLNDAAWGGTTQDAIDVIRFTLDWVDPNNTMTETISIPVSNFDAFPCAALGYGFSCIPQMGGTGLDGIPEVIMNIPKFRGFGTHESIVLSYITDATNGNNHSAIRWVELRKTPGNEWELYQEGTYSPDMLLHRFMPSIAIDKEGNIGLAYNVSSENDFVGIRYTGRFVNDPLGQMTVNEYNVVDGAGTIASGGRFGDYSQMGVDPLNGTTFWYTTEYAGTGAQVTQTRIVAFELHRDTFDLAVTALVAPVSAANLSATETVTISVRNTGLEPMVDYDLGFFLDGNLIAQVTIPDTIYSAQQRDYSFTTTVDLSAFQTYEFKSFVTHPMDLNPLNDTLVRNVTNLLTIDAAITLEQVPSSCAENTLIPVSIFNNGANDITAGNFEITLNGVLVNTIAWTGSVSAGITEAVEVEVGPLVSGNNAISIVFTDVNGSGDLNTSNNSGNTFVIYDANLEQFFVNITPDDYPGEISWDITDDNGAILADGAGYSSPSVLDSRDICLPKNQCFTFTIYDVYGDGICCYYGQGGYNMTAANGDTVFSSTGEYTYFEVQSFCAMTTSCALAATFLVVDDTGSDDGSIMINATGGAPPYMYSIDGGATAQTTPLFEDLPAGVYDVVVYDITGTCTFQEDVVVDLFIATTDVESNNFFHVKPNPNNGYFTIEFSQAGITSPSLIFEVFDAKGALVQSRRMGSYNGVYIAPISLIAYPSGTYFVRIKGKDFSIAKRVVTVK